MEKVRLDFRARGGSSRLGKALAALGALSILACGMAFAWLLGARLDLEQSVRAQQQAVQAHQGTGPMAASYDPDGEVARRLARPWQALLLAIESVASPRIALIEIRPDPQARQLRLTGEAANLDEALAYLRQLQTLPVLSRPHLLNYGPVQTPGAPPALRFVVQAEWLNPSGGQAQGETRRGSP